MERNYTREEYLARIQTIKASPRKIAISTDIIVGFPGETREDFEQTLSLLDEVEYDSIFSFKYSPRAGTPAAAYTDAVPEEEQSWRLSILQEKQRRIQVRRHEQMIGLQEEVLVEGRREKSGQWIGRTSQNRVLNFADPGSLAAGENLLGAFCRVRVTGSGPNSLVGELLAKEPARATHGFRILQ
jgi:tRNA-2-methylthio-N6-dimethylallyladenosine synthase